MQENRLSATGISTLLWLTATCALAEDYPARPVRVVVPYGPGTGVDVVARLVSETLANKLGQSFVIDNRPGAAGTIGVATVAAAPATGYSILVNASSHTSVPAIMRNLPYDAARDFAGVTLLGESPLVLVIARSRGVRSVSELIAAAKAKPGSISFGSAGVGTATYVSAEKFRRAAGFEAVHVPYKSTTDALVDVMAGRIDYTYTALVSALPGVQDGRLAALALGSRRSPVLPNVPTIVEAGVPNADYSLWFGMFVPAKTPRDIVHRLNRETVQALATAELKEKLAKIGVEPITLTPEQYDALIRRELIENERLMKAAGIKPE